MNKCDKTPRREVGFWAVVVLTFGLFVIVPTVIATVLSVFGVIPVLWLLPVFGMFFVAWLWLVVSLQE